MPEGKRVTLWAIGPETARLRTAQPSAAQRTLVTKVIANVTAAGLLRFSVAQHAAVQLTVNHNIVVPDPRQATADLVYVQQFSFVRPRGVSRRLPKYLLWPCCSSCLFQNIEANVAPYQQVGGLLDQSLVDVVVKGLQRTQRVCLSQRKVLKRGRCAGNAGTEEQCCEK